MSRKLLLGLMIAALIGAGSAWAIDVYPTGFHPTDICSVQAAVDLGGTVTLKAGTFNFGPSVKGNFVTIKNSVILQGEGAHATKIEGGLSTTISAEADIVDVTIQNLWFDKNHGSCLRVYRCGTLEGSKVTIINNKFTNVLDELANYGVNQGSQCIIVSEIPLTNKGGHPYWGWIGDVEITNNFINTFPKKRIETDGWTKATGPLAFTCGILCVGIPPDRHQNIGLPMPYIDILYNTFLYPGHTAVINVGDKGVSLNRLVGNHVTQREYNFDKNDFLWIWDHRDRLFGTGYIRTNTGFFNSSHENFGGPPAPAFYSSNILRNCITGFNLNGSENTQIVNNDIEIVQRRGFMEESKGGGYPDGWNANSSAFRVGDIRNQGPCIGVNIHGNRIHGISDFGSDLRFGATQISVINNDFSKMVANTAQIYLYVSPYNNTSPDHNTFQNNTFGVIGKNGEAGIKCEGDYNTFTSNTWTTNYPKWPGGKGIWWMTTLSNNNAVVNPTVTGGLNVDIDLYWLNEGSANTILTP